MRKIFAVPTIDGKLCQHFGHCEKFALIETDGKVVKSTSFVSPPVHQPGAYPKFLADKDVKVIISGGMGSKAQDLFMQNNIEVYMGVDSDSPEKLVEHYLADNLTSGQNLCDH